MSGFHRRRQKESYEFHYVLMEDGMRMDDLLIIGKLYVLCIPLEVQLQVGTTAKHLSCFSMADTGKPWQGW